MWLVLLVLLQMLMISSTLKVTKLRVDEYGEKGKGKEMVCEYDLEGDRLYSVKWYKDNQEFYRYVPRDHPKKQQFYVKGVDVQIVKSDENKVYIDNMSMDTSGTFTCEVSTEAPSFKTSALDKEMKVVNPPDSGPLLIVGTGWEYRVGDILDINCTSPPSNPPALLRFYINDQMVDGSKVITHPMKEERNQLYVPTIALGFRVKRNDFQQHLLKIKCTSTIYNVYFESTVATFNGVGLGEKALLSISSNTGSKKLYLQRILLLFTLCLSKLFIGSNRSWFVNII